MTSKLSCILLVVAAVTVALTQEKPDNVAVDPSEAYVYIAFDHVGERKPVLKGEVPQALWLRLVNNCRLPITVAVFNLGTGSGVSETGVYYDILPAESGSLDARSIEQRHWWRKEKQPRGPAMSVGSSVRTLPPGGSLLFSVPINHVSPNWYLRVPFLLGPFNAEATRNVHSYVDFVWSKLPEEYRNRKPRELAETNAPRGQAGANATHEAGHAQAVGP
jgi:SAM-dependent methyltransferase